MAFSFGGGVRPELGRTDFTPFLQGSVQGAQMQARGAENFAKGVASAGDSVAQGVKTYFANKELVASRIGKIEGGMSDPEVMKRVMASGEGSKLLKTMQDKGTLSLKDSALLFSLVDEAKEATATDMKRQVMQSQIDAQRELAARNAMGFMREEQQNKALVTAVSLNTTPDGKVDWNGVAPTLAELGVNPLDVAPKLKSMQDMAQESSVPKQSEAEARIDRMVEAGVPRLDAIRINDGILELRTDPITGDMSIVDKATGTARRVASPEREDVPMIEPPKEGETLAEMAERATGIGASFLAAAQRVVGLGGQLGGKNLSVPGAQEVIQFRQFFDASVQELVRSLSVNPRYPVSEMERIRKEVDIMPGGFTDPQTLRAKMLGLDRYLEAKLEAEERDANNRRLSVEDRSNAESSAETIRRFRNILGADRIRQMPAGSSFGGNVIEVDF
jgi:hypothetical protein